MINKEDEASVTPPSLCDCFTGGQKQATGQFGRYGPSHLRNPSHFADSSDYYASFASQRDTIVKLKNLPISTAGETLPFLQHY